MSIQQVTVYRFNGKDYASFAKAKDAAEDRVVKLLTRLMIELGFSANEAFKVAQALIANKGELEILLQYPTTEALPEHPES